VSGGEVRDLAALGEITPQMLRDTFPKWRVFESGGVWWALREGKAEEDGPRSLLRIVIGARDVPGLAEKLCLQEWLDGLDPAELDAVWRDVALPEVPG
jgi:hypothetical protein